MSITRTRSLSLGGGQSLRAVASVTPQEENYIEVPVPGPSTDLEVGLVVDASQVSLIAIVCDQDITIKTNSSGVPVQTFTLSAGKVFFWESGGGLTNPITTDITKIFVTSVASVDATLQIMVWQDATP